MSPELTATFANPSLSPQQLVDKSCIFKDFEMSSISDNAGLNYNVVTVLGCQNSGKSTILNELFSTNFDVLNAKNGINQTTQGIWMQTVTYDCGDGQPKPLVVIDVEGTDSQERGGNGRTFENRSALMSLALGDMVIINMFYTAMGTITGSGFNLLKSVLNVNFKLFQNQENPSKTILAIFIRDYNSNQAPFDKIYEKITTNLETFWKEIKEKNQNTLEFEDFFELRVICFPHQQFAEKEFKTKCRNTKMAFPFPIQYTRGIPLDGFCHYCKNIWQKIVNNKEIDIPSEQALISTFRCEELKNSALVFASGNIQDIFLQRKNGNFGDKAMKIHLLFAIEQSYNTYLSSAINYDETIAVQMKKELLESIFTNFKEELMNFLEYRQPQIVQEASKSIEILVMQIEKNLQTNQQENLEETYLEETFNLFDEYTSLWTEVTINKFQALLNEFAALELAGGITIELKINITQKLKNMKDSLKNTVKFNRKDLEFLLVLALRERKIRVGNEVDTKVGNEVNNNSWINKIVSFFKDEDNKKLAFAALATCGTVAAALQKGRK